MQGIGDGMDDTQGTSSKTLQDTRRIDEIQGTKSTNRRDSVPIVTSMYPDMNRDLERGIKRKKGVGEGVRKMQTYKELDSDGDEIIGIETRAMSEIVANLEGNVKILIDQFLPIIRTCPEKIRQQMLNRCKDWKYKKETFIGAINYIEHGRQDTRNTKLDKLELDSLCDILIREIDNRMPNHCNQCNEWYIVRLSDKPEIHCMWCKVGKHDCIEVNEILEDQGFKWLCGTCEPVFTKHFLPKLERTASFEGFIESVTKKSDTKKSENA